MLREAALRKGKKTKTTKNKTKELLPRVNQEPQILPGMADAFSNHVLRIE